MRETISEIAASDAGFNEGQVPNVSCTQILVRFKNLFEIELFPGNMRGRGLIMKRTHHCNQLRPAHIGQRVTLSGWVHSRRDLGGLIFIDVRDREGRTQTVFDPSELSKELFEQAGSLRSECVISVTGKVRQRPAGTNNPKIATGEIELAVTALELLNYA